MVRHCSRQSSFFLRAIPLGLVLAANLAFAQMTMPTTGVLPTGTISRSLILGDSLNDLRSQWVTPDNPVQQGWVNQINSVANGSVSPSAPTTFGAAAGVASIAEAAGLRFAMTGSSGDLNKVVTALLNADVPAPTGSAAQNSFIIRPEVLTSYLSAYDYIRGASTADLSATTRSQIESRLVTLTQSLDYGNGTYSNARGKIGATQALAGEILQNQSLLDTGLTNLNGHFAYSTTDDGWFTDSPGHYLNYTLRHLTLFARAYQQGSGVDVWQNIDPYVNMTLGLRLPDGSTPNVSDGLVLRTATSLFSQSTDPEIAGEAVWSLQAGLPTNYDGYSGTNVLNNTNSPATYFALIDFDKVTAQAPTESPTFLATGQSKVAVFRNDWSTTSDYLLLSPGIDSPATEFINGPIHVTLPAFHSANDTGEILVASKGQYILVSAGYLRTDLSNSPPALGTLAADQHNVILVDGNVGNIGGSLPSPNLGQTMRPEDFVQTNRLDSKEYGNFKGVSDFSSLEMNYNDTTVRRNIAFPGEDYFAVADRMMSGTSHTYGFNLIGRGTRTVLTNTSDRVEVKWELNGAQVIEHLFSTGSMNLATATTWMHLTFNNFEQTYGMTANITGTNSLFLSVIETGMAGAASQLDINQLADTPDMLALSVHHQSMDWTDTLMTQLGHASQIAGDLGSDANYAYMRVMGGVLQNLMMAEGTYFDFQGARVLEASDALTLSLLFDTSDLLLGTISADGLIAGTELKFFHQGIITGAWLDGNAISFSNSGGFDSVYLNGGGSLRVEFAAIPEVSTLTLLGTTIVSGLFLRSIRRKN